MKQSRITFPILRHVVLSFVFASLATTVIGADRVAIVEVEGQPLAANVQRLLQALKFLGAPLPEEVESAVSAAATSQNAEKVQEALDPHVLCVVTVNPELRVKATRGPAKVTLQQEGYTPVLIKVINDSGASRPLRITSPQSGPVYAGASKGTMERERQQWLRENENTTGRKDRFLQVEMFTAPADDAGAERAAGRVRRRPDLLGRGGQARGDDRLRRRPGDAGPRLPRRGAGAVRRAAGGPGEARGHRLRRHADDGPVHVPRRGGPRLPAAAEAARPGPLLPEADLPRRRRHRAAAAGRVHDVVRPRAGVPLAATQDHRARKGDRPKFAVKLERWINPADFGFYSGDHHIHAAGCAHYTTPDRGMQPEDMFLHVKGEGLNVGCCSRGAVLRLSAAVLRRAGHPISEPFTLAEVRRGGERVRLAALGHVCLLNLRDQTYPGADGIKGWPTWTTPRCGGRRQQGGGHRLRALRQRPAGECPPPRRSGCWSCRREQGRPAHARGGERTRCCPKPFEKIDADSDGGLNEAELLNSHERVADQLPNLAIPE